MSLRVLLFPVLTCGLLLTAGDAVRAQQPCTPTSTLKTTAALAWTAPIQPANVTTIGYVVERQIGTGPWTKLAEVSLTPLVYTDTNLTPNNTYTWRVLAMARNNDGSVGTSGPASHGTPPPCLMITVVNAPTNLTATPQ